MDHSKHVRLSDAELTIDVLDAATIYGADDEKIGFVDHVHGYGAEARVAIDISGFLGLGSRRIAVAAKELDFMRDEHGTVHGLTRRKKDEMRAMPEHTDL